MKKNLVLFTSIILTATASLTCEETVGLLESFLGTTGTAAAVTPTLTSIADVRNYLSAASGGATPANPVTLKVNFALGWQALLSAIASAGKYVDLDLTLCSMSGTEFDPVTKFNLGWYNTGKSRIVSLTLPNAATSIKAGNGSTRKTAAFRYFTALKSVSGAAVQTICEYAFAYCAALTTVSLPKAASIGHGAFAYCAALTTVSLPSAASIGNSAFHSCVALTTVSLPKAASIGHGAFAYCAALTTVSLPSAASIGEVAFAYCTALTKVSLPKAASIGSTAFVYCTALTKVSLPAAASIGEVAFYMSSEQFTEFKYF